jgi:hypothetical protein
MLREAISEAGVPVTSDEKQALPYEELVSSRRTRWLHFTWSDVDVAPDEDRIEAIEADKLQSLGEALSLVATTIVRQSSY